jgi:hypothetical protein
MAYQNTQIGGAIERRTKLPAHRAAFSLLFLRGIAYNRGLPKVDIPESEWASASRQK